MTQTIIGIEIGTSKTVALAAEYRESTGLIITGMGIIPTIGVI